MDIELKLEKEERRQGAKKKRGGRNKGSCGRRNTVPKALRGLMGEAHLCFARGMYTAPRSREEAGERAPVEDVTLYPKPCAASWEKPICVLLEVCIQLQGEGKGHERGHLWMPQHCTQSPARPHGRGPSVFC